MHHELFAEITTPASRRTGSPYTIAVSIVAHVIVIATIVIVPLFALDVLPRPPADGDIWVTPVVPNPPPLPAAPRLRPQTNTVVQNQTTVSYEAPEGVHDEVERAVTVDVPRVPGGVGDGDLTALGKDTTRAAPQPPVQPQPVGPVPVGGRIREPRRVFSVAPAYPAIARQARVQGMVVIQAVIGVDGAVRDAQVQNSVPLLDQAALDAVRQWRYQPTLLNGTPVAVIMTVSVRFTLE